MEMKIYCDYVFLRGMSVTKTLKDSSVRMGINIENEGKEKYQRSVIDRVMRLTSEDIWCTRVSELSVFCMQIIGLPGTIKQNKTT